MKIIISELSQIHRAAKEFLEALGDNRIIAFYGEMGAGKTTFIKALCDVLGVEDIVNSPTFTIINEYRTDSDDSIYHFDFYRINKIEEVLDIGFEEYLYGDGLLLMEWPEKIEPLLPENTLRVSVKVNEDGSREICL